MRKGRVGEVLNVIVSIDPKPLMWHGIGSQLRDCKARQDKARQGKTRQDKARQGKARQGKTRQDKARQGKERQGKGRKDSYLCEDRTVQYILNHLQNAHLYENPSVLLYTPILTNIKIYKQTFRCLKI